jgi:hypothetical protein
VSKADDHMRSTRNQVRERAEVEHSWGFGFTHSPADETGRHREGSARAFYGADAPTGLGFGEDPNTLTEDIDATTTLDEGRLWHDTDTGELKITTADPNWVDAVTAFNGNASNRIDLLSGVQFLKAGEGAVDLHAHGSRHTDVTDPNAYNYDYISNVIQGVTDPNDTTEIADDMNNSTYTSLVSTTKDLTGRRSTSHGILVASVNVDSGSTRIGTFCLHTSSDTACTSGAMGHTRQVLDLDTGGTQLIFFRYVKGLAASSHTWYINGILNSDATTTVNYPQFYFIDLGLE